MMRRPPQGMVALAAVGAPQEPLELEAARAGAGVLLAPPVAALRVLAGAAAEALVAAPVAVRGGAALEALLVLPLEALAVAPVAALAVAPAGAEGGVAVGAAVEENVIHIARGRGRLFKAVRFF